MGEQLSNGDLLSAVLVRSPPSSRVTFPDHSSTGTVSPVGKAGDTYVLDER